MTMLDTEFVRNLAIIERKCYHHTERLRVGEFTFMSRNLYIKMLNDLEIAAMAVKVMRMNGFKYDFEKLNIDMSVPSPALVEATRRA